MNIKRKRIAVIGGDGKMGRWLSGLLLEDGVKVIIADADEKSLVDAGRRLEVDIADSNIDVLRGVDCILLSVPIEGFEEVVREIGPRVRSEQVVIDITSTKERPVELMHRYIENGRVLGAHPLFGPGAASITNTKANTRGVHFFIDPSPSTPSIIPSRAKVNTLSLAHVVI